MNLISGRNNFVFDALLYLKPVKKRSKVNLQGTGHIVAASLYSLLGRLPKVDLIILEGGGKCPSVRPSTKSFFDFNEIWYIGRGR